MGFHTWFYNRVDLTFEEAQQKARDYVHFCIELNKQTYNDSLNETDPFMKEHLLSIYDPDYERKVTKDLEEIEKGDHYYICKNLNYVSDWFCYADYGFAILTETDYHDVFRISPDCLPYDDFRLNTLDETIAFLNFIEYDKIIWLRNLSLDTIKEFWDKYPKGQIAFG